MVVVVADAVDMLMLLWLLCVTVVFVCAVVMVACCDIAASKWNTPTSRNTVCRSTAITWRNTLR